MSAKPHPPSTSNGSDRDGLLDRITVSLAPRAVDDLRRIQARTRLSKTDVVNRAIALYEFVHSAMERGSEVWIRNEDSGEHSRVQLL